MADTGMLERKLDHSEEVQAAIPESIRVANASGLDDALELLLSYEKKCRLGNDFSSLKEVVLHMIRMCRERDWAKMVSTITVIAKRRAQSKHAITAMVKECMTYLDDSPSKEAKMDLLTTLRDVCEGKIYVEGDGAKLTMMIAKLKEEDGDVEGACEAIQDVHVETYGSLSKLEKAQYILEQIRLNLLRQDYVRALIQSRKMNRKILEEEELQEAKVGFYDLMVQYHMHERDSWELCQCYFRKYDTAIVKENEEQRHETLRCTVLFLLLSEFNNHQSDMMHRVMQLKDLESLPAYKHALTLFTTPEIIAYPFQHLTDLETHPALGGAAAEHWRQTMHTRVVQHNVRVVSKYFTRIRTQRLAELLGLTVDETERHLSEMVGTGELYVKIDRPQGICSFVRRKEPEAVLSDWNSDIGKLLSVMEATCHLVNREMMMMNATRAS